MNLPGQILIVNGLNATVSQDATTANATVAMTPSNDGKLLINNQFTDVLQEQQEQLQYGAGWLSLLGSTVETGSQMQGSAETLVAEESLIDGKLLPESGTVLPSVANVMQLPPGIQDAGQVSTATAAPLSVLSSKPEGYQQALSSNSQAVTGAGIHGLVNEQAGVISTIVADPGVSTGGTGRSVNITDTSRSLANHNGLLSTHSSITSTSVSTVPAGIESTMQPGASVRGGQLGMAALEMNAQGQLTLQMATTAQTTEQMFPAARQLSEVPIPQVHSNTGSASLSYQQTGNTNPVPMAVPIAVGSPGWGNAVMEKVMWMSSQQVNSAEIALDPPELGPLQVRVSTQHDQTSVVFSSQHAVVRDALDLGLARLREMMEQQGLNLADVDVSDQSAQQHANTQNHDIESDNELRSPGNDELAQEGVAPDESGAMPTVSYSTGLVDHYV